jgi:hypothetical protein
MNTWGYPTGKLDGDAGTMVIEDKVAVVAGFDEQPMMPRLKMAINPKVRQGTRNRRCLIFIIIYPSSLEL